MRWNQRGYIIKKEDGSEMVNYNNDAFPSYIHYGEIYPGATWSNVAHFHQDLEFITVCAGQMAYNVNGRNIFLKEGDTIFVNSGQVHYSIPTSEDECRYYIYILHPSILCSTYIVESEYVEPITSNDKLPYIHFKANDSFGKRMHEAAEEIYSAYGNEFKITVAFFNLWRIIMDFCKERGKFETVNVQSSALICFKSMMAYIHENFAQKITLDDIAQAGNVSRTYCNKLFKSFTSQSPMENLLRYRVEKVASYLGNSGLSMSDIAQKTGFSGASYMTESFRKVYGKSPRDYKGKKEEDYVTM